MKKPEVAANLIEYINTQIITGRYPVGSKLPSLRLLARKFQISYTSAWNGIEYLEHQGKKQRYHNPYPLSQLTTFTGCPARYRFTLSSAVSMIR